MHIERQLVDRQQGENEYSVARLAATARRRAVVFVSQLEPGLRQDSFVISRNAARIARATSDNPIRLRDGQVDLLRDLFAGTGATVRRRERDLYYLVSPKRGEVAVVDQVFVREYAANGGVRPSRYQVDAKRAGELTDPDDIRALVIQAVRKCKKYASIVDLAQIINTMFGAELSDEIPLGALTLPVTSSQERRQKAVEYIPQSQRDFTAELESLEKPELVELYNRAILNFVKAHYEATRTVLTAGSVREMTVEQLTDPRGAGKYSAEFVKMALDNTKAK